MYFFRKAWVHRQGLFPSERESSPFFCGRPRGCLWGRRAWLLYGEIQSWISDRTAILKIWVAGPVLCYLAELLPPKVTYFGLANLCLNYYVRKKCCFRPVILARLSFFTPSARRLCSTHRFLLHMSAAHWWRRTGESSTSVSIHIWIEANK